MSRCSSLTRSAVVASLAAVIATATIGATAGLAPEPPGLGGRVALATGLSGQALATSTLRAPAAAPIATTPVTASAATSGVTGRRTTPSSRVVRIRRYADAPGSQRAIDACRLVLWTVEPLWLAAHNYCGYQWLAFVPTGTVLRVTTGRAAGRYVVTGHRRLDRQSGALPRVRAELVLQTCIGRGTGLTLARRVR